MVNLERGRFGWVIASWSRIKGAKDEGKNAWTIGTAYLGKNPGSNCGKAETEGGEQALLSPGRERQEEKGDTERPAGVSCKKKRVSGSTCWLGRGRKRLVAEFWGKRASAKRKVLILSLTKGKRER